MAKQPSSVPPPMAFGEHADNVRKRAEDAEERAQAVATHNAELQERLWQQQQQL